MQSLAIDGGEAVRKEPFPSWPCYGEDEIEAVRDVLRSGKVNYWTGNQAREFESEFAASIQRRYGVALANGSLALEVALRALSIGPGDEVVVPPRTFIATASSVVLQGATPVFADIDPDSQNITPESIEKVVTERTKAVIVVHLAGWPCRMDEVLELADRRNFKVVEDCAQAHGAGYVPSRSMSGHGSTPAGNPAGTMNGQLKPVGSFGQVACFSFCQDKIISTGGEGGMLVTDDEAVFQRAWSYKDHGKSYEAVYNRQHPPGFRWLHESFGTNLRMTEMQSVIGRRQLSKLDSWVAKRRDNAAFLNSHFKSVNGLRVTEPGPREYHSYYKYYCFLRPEQLRPGWSRDRVIQAVAAEGIPCQSGSCSEVYLERAFDEEVALALGRGQGARVKSETGQNQSLRPKERLPVARELGETSLMLLVHPTLEDGDLLDTVRAVKKVMEAAIR